MVCNVIHFIRLSSHLPSLHKLYTEAISKFDVAQYRSEGFVFLLDSHHITHTGLLQSWFNCIFILHTIYGLTAVGDADFKGLDIAAVAGLLKLFLVQTHSMNIHSIHVQWWTLFRGWIRKHLKKCPFQICMTLHPWVSYLRDQVIYKYGTYNSYTNIFWSCTLSVASQLAAA